MIPLDLFNDPTGTLYWSWHDYTYEWEFGIIGLLVGLYVFLRFKLSGKDSNVKPLSMLDVTDKSGLIDPYEISAEQEGASFLIFEMTNGEVERRRIGQPFTFYLANDAIERHHLNCRGAFDCVDPAKLFQNYKPDPAEKNVIVAETTQHIRELRLGGQNLDKPSRHFRMFVLLFIMACMIGVGLAASFQPRH